MTDLLKWPAMATLIAAALTGVPDYLGGIALLWVCIFLLSAFYDAAFGEAK